MKPSVLLANLFVHAESEPYRGSRDAATVGVLLINVYIVTIVTACDDKQL